MPAKKILLFGMCGAGKDTQAELLSKRWNIPIFSLGGMLRVAVHEPGPWQTEIAHALETGNLISTQISREIMKQKLLDPVIQTSGYILVGYPRKLETLEDFLTYETPTHAVLFTIPREVALKRSLERARIDDVPELIERRISRFFEEELPVWECLNADTRITCIEIDAERSIDEVVTDLIVGLDERRAS